MNATRNSMSLDFRNWIRLTISQFDFRFEPLVPKATFDCCTVCDKNNLYWQEESLCRKEGICNGFLRPAISTGYVSQNSVAKWLALQKPISIGNLGVIISIMDTNLPPLMPNIEFYLLPKTDESSLWYLKSNAMPWDRTIQFDQIWILKKLFTIGRSIHAGS